MQVEPIDAVITAGGRLHAGEARAYGTDVKALVRVNGRTLLESVVAALRAVGCVARIVVVGPAHARSYAAGADEWIDEFATGEENLMAALVAAQTERCIVSASDLPYVRAASYESLLALTPRDADAGYPIFTRREFGQAYPRGRDRYARLADGAWTGGSAVVLRPAVALRNRRLIARGFAARKSLTALASILGPALLIRYALGTARVGDVERRAAAMMGGKVVAVRGADPALAMDCDDARDLDYAGAERVS